MKTLILKLHMSVHMTETQYRDKKKPKKNLKFAVNSIEEELKRAVKKGEITDYLFDSEVKLI